MQAAMCLTRGFFNRVEEICLLLEGLGMNRRDYSRESVLDFLGKESTEGKILSMYWRELDRCGWEHVLWHTPGNPIIPNDCINKGMRRIRSIAL